MNKIDRILYFRRVKFKMLLFYKKKSKILLSASNIILTLILTAFSFYYAMKSYKLTEKDKTQEIQISQLSSLLKTQQIQLDTLISISKNLQDINSSSVTQTGKLSEQGQMLSGQLSYAEKSFQLFQKDYQSKIIEGKQRGKADIKQICDSLVEFVLFDKRKVYDSIYVFSGQINNRFLEFFRNLKSLSERIKYNK